MTYLAKDGEDPNHDWVIVPQTTQLISAYDLHHVTFRGLTVEHDNYVLPKTGHSSKEMELDVTSAISFQNSSNITWDASVVRHTSGGGLDFISCLDSSVSPLWCRQFEADKTDSNNQIVNSAFYDLGLHGIRIGDQFNDFDTDTNVPENFTVENNVIEGYGRVIPASFGIAQGNGNHNTYSHNDVYDGYHCAISLIESAPDGSAPTTMGNAFNTIAYNDVHDLLQGIMNDGGSIRIESGTARTSPPGNRIWNNKIHDTTDASIIDTNGYGGAGIYLDNDTGSVDVENNLVYRVSAIAVYAPHGPQRDGFENIVQNNILAFARKGMVGVNNPYANQTAPDFSSTLLFKFSHNLMYFDRFLSLSPTQFDPGFSVNADCTWTTHKSPSRYPGFLFLDDNDYWRTDRRFASDTNAFHIQTAEDTSNGGSSPCAEPNMANYSLFDWFSFAQWQSNAGEDQHSVVTDPHFANPAFPYDDYRLVHGAPISGFVPFDADEDGRLWWARWYVPPPVAPTFSTMMFNKVKDF